MIFPEHASMHTFFEKSFRPLFYCSLFTSYEALIITFYCVQEFHDSQYSRHDHNEDERAL